MAESRGYGLGDQPADMEQITREAQHRWLRPAEICEILRNYKKFGISPQPATQPASGSFFLFDRKVQRYFRKDGHNWRKRNGKLEKEGHAKLKVGGSYVLDCYYAYGEENENFQRRSYWMLEEDLSHIVLVQYREVELDQGNRTNFNHICSIHPNNSQVPSQTTNTDNAQESEYEDTESAKEDSFIKWMNMELGDVKEYGTWSHSMASWDSVEGCSRAYCDSVEGESRVDESSISPLGPTLSQDQLFSIINISPNWTYEGSEIKVRIMGTFLKNQQEAENCEWSCMFGEVEVPAEVIADGVLGCLTPIHKAARVPFYVTRSNRLACSEVREFEYRFKPVEDADIIDNYSDSGNEILHKRCLTPPPSYWARFKRVLRSVVREFEHRFKPVEHADVIDNYSDSGNKILQIRFVKLLCLGSVCPPKEDGDEWHKMLELDSPERVQEKMLEKLLKEKLHIWLQQKAAEGGKGPSVLDKDGQGVLHFAAALGYDWALEPTILAGVSVNFRDVNGWTALHWAAFCGRECTVASLVSLGAAPGVVTDPCPKYPSGRTPADLASANGHKGIAGYLAESALSAHLSSLKLDTKDGDAAEIPGAKAVQTVSERSATPISDGDLPDGLSLKDSLAAVCNATPAAARIHQVYRKDSFQKKQLKEYGDDAFGMSEEEQALSFLAVKTHKSVQHDLPVHAAAIRIQNKFRSWKGRKEFLIIRRRIVKIQDADMESVHGDVSRLPEQDVNQEELAHIARRMDQLARGMDQLRQKVSQLGTAFTAEQTRLIEVRRQIEHINTIVSADLSAGSLIGKAPDGGTR